MKNILKIKLFCTRPAIVLFSLAYILFFTSCAKDFLDRRPMTSVPEEEALETLVDIQSAVMGLHASLRNPAYYGRTMLVVGDIAADVSTKKYAVSDNWYAAIETYSISENMQEPAEMWAMMYRVVDRSARIITAAKPLLTNGTASDQRKMNFCIAQAYAMKGLSLFNLTNVFGLPYKNTAEDERNLGVILVGDTIVHKGDAVYRASVKETYAQIVRDIDSAKYYAALSMTTGAFTQMNTAAVFALEARVKLYMKDYQGAKAAAENAITKRRGSLVTSAAAYKEMWETALASNEDIFVLTSNSAEQNGTSSISHFYGNPGYSGRMSPIACAKIADNDFRRSVMLQVTGDEYRPMKYPNYASSINKIPVFRLAEMYLIQAEAENELNDLGAAQTALLNIAKRNPAVLTIADLPQNQSDLRDFIKDERVRELFAEGHRWFDMRRNGDKLNRAENESLKIIVDYDIAKFCYPIPLTEINASGIKQNDWINNLPQNTNPN